MDLNPALNHLLELSAADSGTGGEYWKKVALLLESADLYRARAEQAEHAMDRLACSGKTPSIDLFKMLGL